MWRIPKSMILPCGIKVWVIPSIEELAPNEKRVGRGHNFVEEVKNYKTWAA
jgi:hypothetical protein